MHACAYSSAAALFSVGNEECLPAAQARPGDRPAAAAVAEGYAAIPFQGKLKAEAPGLLRDVQDQIFRGPEDQASVPHGRTTGSQGVPEGDALPRSGFLSLPVAVGGPVLQPEGPAYLRERLGFERCHRPLYLFVRDDLFRKRPVIEPAGGVGGVFLQVFDPPGRVEPCGRSLEIRLSVGGGVGGDIAQFEGLRHRLPLLGLQGGAGQQQEQYRQQGFPEHMG